MTGASVSLPRIASAAYVLLLAAFVCAPARASAPDTDPRSALREAALLAQQGRLEDAERRVGPALADPATRAVAQSILGGIRLQQQQLGESARLLEDAIRLEPRLIGAHLTLAQVYTLEKKPKAALGLYRRVIELDPSNASARIALARSEVEAGSYRAALNTAAPAMAAFKQTPDGLLVLATALLKTGDRHAAAALTADWTRLSGIPQAWTIQFAVLLAREGAPAAAVEILEGARTAGSSYELEFNLAGAHVLNKDPAGALDAYDAALALKPDSRPALLQAAALAERQGELERSLSYWIRLRKIAPEDPDTLLGFGRVCLKMDLLEDAEPALTKAAALKPDDLAAQYTLAAALVGKRQYESAQRLLERLLASRRDDPQLQYALGAVLYTQGHLDDAVAHLEESVRLQPEQLASPYYLALAARDRGDDAQAIETLSTLLRRYPNHAPSCEALGGLLMGARQYDEAERRLRDAVRLNPKSVKAHYQLGLLLARVGRKPEADAELTLAESLRKDDAESSRLQLRLLDAEP